MKNLWNPTSKGLYTRAFKAIPIITMMMNSPSKIEENECSLSDKSPVNMAVALFIFGLEVSKKKDKRIKIKETTTVSG